MFSHGHLTLQQIVRDGPKDGDFVGALESARWKVVDEGVKSAEDGMVCCTYFFCPLTPLLLVQITDQWGLEHAAYLRLVGSA